MAESLRMIGENTAKISGGSYITAKWQEIVHPKPEETRTADEVIAHVLGKLKEV